MVGHDPKVSGSDSMVGVEVMAGVAVAVEAAVKVGVGVMVLSQCDSTAQRVPR